MSEGLQTTTSSMSYAYQNKSNKMIKNSNDDCESIGCNENATSKILVKVGDRGHILLFLSEKCKTRFNH